MKRFALLALTLVLAISGIFHACAPKSTTPADQPFPATGEQGYGSWKLEPGYLAVATTGFKEIGSGETRSLTFNTSLEDIDTTLNFTLPSEFKFTLSACGDNTVVYVSLGESSQLKNVDNYLTCSVESIEASGWSVDKETEGVWNLKIK